MKGLVHGPDGAGHRVRTRRHAVVIVGRAESRGNRLVMDEAPLGLAPLHGGGAADQMETTSGTMPRGFMAVDGA